MRLFLPILLMSMVLANQSLCAVHMHIGTHSAELGSHAGVPHFHVEAGHGHSHGHGGLHANGGETSEFPQAGIAGFPDHHIGAYYLSDSVSRDTSRLPEEKLAELLNFNDVDHEQATLALGSCLICKPNGQNVCCLSGIARVPLFLRDASMRC